MADSTPTPPSSSEVTKAQQSAESTPGRCFRGAIISGGLAIAMYSLTQSIMQTLGNTPLPDKSATALNIAVAVRTLVVGVSTLATSIFAISTLGLLALGVKLLLQQKTQKSE